jgi:two-component system sensor histidine kinase KdpD
MRIYRLSKQGQYLLSVGVVSSIVLIGAGVHDLVGHRVIGFLLLLGVSCVALFVDIRPVILGALLSALAWDYLFIPPRFTLTIGATEDRILLATYFIVVVIHAVLTYRIREINKRYEGRKLRQTR